MNQSLEDALSYLRQHSSSKDESAYRAACETVAANLDQLPYPVFVVLPGGLEGNCDPVWDAVKAASQKLCGCGNERTFEPGNPRREFEPSAAEPVVMSLGQTVYVRAVGAPATSAYAEMEIKGRAGDYHWILVTDPMKPGIDFSALFGPQEGFTLAALAEGLTDSGEAPTLMHPLANGLALPLLSVLAADPKAGTVTIHLDAAIEVFDPQEEPSHAH